MKLKFYKIPHSILNLRKVMYSTLTLRKKVNKHLNTSSLLLEQHRFFFFCIEKNPVFQHCRNVMFFFTQTETYNLNDFNKSECWF